MKAPKTGDRVLFGRRSSRDCVWDYDVKLSSMTLTHDYTGRVSLGTHQLEAALNVRVAGGVLDLSSGMLTVGGLLYMDQGGTVQLNRGELRLGRTGLLVDAGGILLSTGNKPARIASAGAEHYSFVVGQGTVNISNPAGTTVERSKGIVLFSRAKVEKAEMVAVKDVPKGATAVTVFAEKAADVDLVDWTFDDSAGKQVEAPAAAKKGKKLVVRHTPPVIQAPAVVEAPVVTQPPVASQAPVEVPIIVKGSTEPVAEEAEVEEAPRGPSMAEALAQDEKIKITPLFNAQFLGGQYFFQGQQGTLSGNASLLAAPVVKFNDRWSLLPVYSASYQGTKQVLDLVGAGTLFQQRMTHRVAAKGVYTPEDSPWRLKPSVSSRWEFLEETRDEKWGSGLFDSRKTGAGFEAEYVYQDPFTVRASYDFALTHFPNYSTLESQQKFDKDGKPLARELVGGHTLDSQTHALTLAGSAELTRGLIIEPSYILLLQHYPNQHIVNAAGDFDGGLRDDATHVVDVTLRHPHAVRDDLKFLASLGLGATFARSNQNSYDALNTRFIAGHYDFDEYSLRPTVTAVMGTASRTEKPMALSLGLAVSQRQYAKRPTQDAVGVYRSSKVRQLNTAVNATVSYPMDPNFSLVGNLQYGRADSNMGFQQFYKYDYSTLNYLFGVSWEY